MKNKKNIYKKIKLYQKGSEGKQIAYVQLAMSSNVPCLSGLQGM